LLPGPELYQELLPGRSVEELRRRGKYLIMCLSGGWRLTAHLRMTGRLLWYDAATSPGPHTHVILDFQLGGQLHFQDFRRFGRWWLTDAAGLDSLSGLAALGPEPIDPNFSGRVLRARLGLDGKGWGGRARIKNALLDQKVIAGLGNIYADEALFAAGIHPLRTVGDLTDDEIERLAAACRQVLNDGIAHRGTTFRDYVDGQGQKGEHKNFLRVFQREGEPCFQCGSPIRRINVAGRSFFHCPACQKNDQVTS
jgi:formamidopyrimidine-DNA glycosylase